jgi:UDP-N-acetylmuramate dehydrogenase
VSDFTAVLAEAFGAGRVQRDVPLRNYTTFRVGGPAQWYLETRTGPELVDAVRLAHQAGIDVVVLGGGSNVLIADGGIRALVLRPRGGSIQRIDEHRIRSDASVTINGLVRWTITHGVAGVEEWAGTPGTVGGAVFGNAHFGGRLISELIAAVRLCSRTAVVADVPGSEMGFGYDRSRPQATGDLVLSADFVITSGDPVLLRERARRSLAHRKRTQPLDMPSAGCIFQNPAPGSDHVPDGIPWSAGALVDRAGLKGRTVGGARVSPTHGNFIVNEGTATAADIRLLIEQCRSAVRDHFGVNLREEIVYLGEFT